jgi:DNA-binding CsgD family transcriptional regulator/DNA polymerase III delta prime subunit
MDTGVIGRKDELSSIEMFLEQVEVGHAGLVFSGEPGIGKTTLWEAALDHARREDMQVLSCRCLKSEASLSFGGLSDLVGPVFEEVAQVLAPPRRHALAVALLLSEPSTQPLGSRAIGLAFLDVVRTLQQRGSVVVAVDDVQWLDPSSSMVLQFALRRLHDERVGFLATLREEPEARVPFEIERSLPEERLRRLSLRPLSLAALHHLLRKRLGLELARPQLVRLREATAGNPLYALELGRELVRTGAKLQPRKPLPVPAGLGTLLEGRLQRLPSETSTVLLAVAALDRPTVEVIAATNVEPSGVLEALELAAKEGVIEFDGSRIRFTHPLLASTCYERAPLWRRRKIHKVLAAVVEEDEERVRHRALAAAGTDADLAADLDAAAVTASARGSNAAAELLDLAADVTPREQGREARRRRMTAALFYNHAGESEHAVAMLEQELPEVPAGGERADVLLLLAGMSSGGLTVSLERFDEALQEAAGDERLTARILATRATTRTHCDLRGALADGRAALEKAERLPQTPFPARPRRIDRFNPEALLTAAVARLAYVETCTLAVTPGLLERGLALEPRLGLASHVTYWDSPSAMLAHRLMLRDELDRARALMEAREAQLTSDAARGAVHLHLTMLEWLSGRWRRALDHGTEAIELRDGDTSARGLQAAALVEAHLGRPEDARPKAEAALGYARASGDEIIAIESLGVLGQLELALGNVEAASGYLRELPGRLVSLGWNDPSSPLWPDTIEALIRSDDLPGARTCLEQYEERARRASRRSQACAARCRGLLAAAESDLPAAFEALERSLAALATLPYPFERARTLLALGQAHRQARKRRASREALEQALAIFERLEARLWALRARSELQRISGRRAGSQQLTETEQRVASLAAQGLSNKEIAAALFMSVHTVEAHLTRVYRKLGIRSRAALAHRLVPIASDVAKV